MKKVFFLFMIAAMMLQSRGAPVSFSINNEATQKFTGNSESSNLFLGIDAKKDCMGICFENSSYSPAIELGTANEAAGCNAYSPPTVVSTSLMVSGTSSTLLAVKNNYLEGSYADWTVSHFMFSGDASGNNIAFCVSMENTEFTAGQKNAG